MSYRPQNGGAVLPIARFGRLGWYIEGVDARGNTWTMQPAGGALTLSEQRVIAQACAAVLRAAGSRTAAAVRDLVYAAADG